MAEESKKLTENQVIEITPEMLEAGLKVLAKWEEKLEDNYPLLFDEEKVCKDLFLAMHSLLVKEAVDS